mgnify:CR=1 FL=1
MEINNLNSNPQSFKGTLKIYDCGGQFNRFKEAAIKSLEQNFAERTQSIEGKMEVILFNRTGENLRPDRFEYSEGTYKDNVEMNVRNCNDDNETLNKFINVFCGFKNIKDMKEKMSMMLR